MARQMFETKDDLTNEWKIAEIVGKKWCVEMQKLPRHQRIDYAMSRNGRVAALCEIKCRTFAWGDYPDVILSLSKIKHAMEMYKAFKLKTFFVVSDKNNNIKYTPIHEIDNYPITYGGRTFSPRDNEDSELIVNISIYDFDNLENRKTNI